MKKKNNKWFWIPLGMCVFIVIVFVMCTIVEKRISGMEQKMSEDVKWLCYENVTKEKLEFGSVERCIIHVSLFVWDDYEQEPDCYVDNYHYADIPRNSTVMCDSNNVEIEDYSFMEYKTIRAHSNMTCIVETKEKICDMVVQKRE